MDNQDALVRLRSLARILLGDPVSPSVNWETMLSLARRHGLSPLLSFQLKQQHSVGQAPDEVLEALQLDYYGALARWMRVEHQLAGILQDLAAAGVPTIVVKGPSIAAAYPHPALRGYGDLDIWVKRAQLDPAERALNDLGYHCIGAHHELLLNHHLPLMVNPKGGLPIELHWRIDDEQLVGRLPGRDLWARSVGWAVDGQPTLCLEPVDAVLYLCRHSVVQHLLYGGIRSLFDLAYLTHGWSDAKWQALVRRAIKYRLVRAVYLMLFLGEQVLGLPAPQDVIQGLRPPGEAPLPSDLARRLFALNGHSALHIPPHISRSWAVDSLPGRLRSLLQSLLLPPEAMAALYDIPTSSPRLWFTYLSRPFTLLRRYGAGWRELILGNQTARAAWQRDVWLQGWIDDEQGEEQP